MARFSVSAWDINTNTKITNLTGATNLHFSERLNDAGGFGIDMNLSDSQGRLQAQLLQNLAGDEFKVVVSTNNDMSILYAGICNQTLMGSKSTAVTFAGKAMPAWFSQVVIANSYTTSVTPGQLIAAAVADAQRVGPGADRGIIPVTSPTQQPAITPTYNKGQYTTVAQILADQTAGITPGTGGTDYFMSHTYINGLPRHVMNIVSPRAGRNSAASGLSIDLKQAIEWSWPTENTQSGNHIIAVGAGTGGAQPVATADIGTPRGGAGQPPRKDLVLQYSQISNLEQLQTIANGAVQRFGQAIATPQVTIPADYPGCALGTFQIGDDIRLRSGPCYQFPNGYDGWWRAIGYDVTVPNEGVPTVTFTFNPPPFF